jgi:hypothetical protein
MALNRLHCCFGQTLRNLIAENVASPANIDAEIQFLIEVVG